ncbi:MAG: zinc ABC transporter substrate-binding protein [Thermofilum sp.]
MRKRVLLAALVAAAVALSLLLYLASPPPREGVGGLRVAVTFPSLYEDVKALLCEGDTVVSIAPPGVDPHEYQLSPRDVELLKSSNLIVSTGHAPFEERIAEMVSRGELEGVLVVIPELPGLRIAKNPATGLPNLHMPIYDPENFRVFLKHLVEAMVKLRPGCAEVYRAREKAVEEEVARLMLQAPRLNTSAVALSPVVQYAVEWMGVRVKYLLIKEHDLPASPEDIAAVERALSRGEVALIVSVAGREDTPLGRKASELASKYGVPIIYVPSGDAPQSTLSKIKQAAEEVGKVAGRIGAGG